METWLSCNLSMWLHVASFLWFIKGINEIWWGKSNEHGVLFDVCQWICKNMCMHTWGNLGIVLLLFPTNLPTVMGYFFNHPKLQVVGLVSLPKLAAAHCTSHTIVGQCSKDFTPNKRTIPLQSIVYCKPLPLTYIKIMINQLKKWACMS